MRITGAELQPTAVFHSSLPRKLVFIRAASFHLFSTFHWDGYGYEKSGMTGNCVTEYADNVLLSEGQSKLQTIIGRLNDRMGMFNM